ncbi:hypothetical protein HYW20_07225 [Candidatus Woesearchaeota archaeon]|nr:hypothetical protein [Candidatus Woesearchaeota archaeon]
MQLKKRGKVILLDSRGQAAIFIVISLIIVLAGLLYFLYQTQFFEKEVDVVPPEIVPVKSYVENCIKSIAEDGLERIGLSGGYINIPERIGNDQRAYLSTFPKSGFRIPYWWHNGIEAVPTEDFIKQQLETHIESELGNCINNFEPFAGRFEINELRQAIASVKFNEEDVSAELNYPLEIIAKNGNFKALREKFSYTVPVRLKKVYELAKLIMERENKDYFLERRTIDLYSMDVDIPTTDIEATCTTKLWQLSSIKDKLKTLVRVNLPYIKIMGTDYNQNIYVPNPQGKNTYAGTYYQQHYVWDIDPNANSKYRNMKVSFAYENWPFSIYARPSENGILRSNAQRGNDMLSFFCLQIWHFTYDISYPALVTIFDQETKNNRAYQFSFPFKVSIDHNQPNRLKSGTALFETEADLPSDEFCSAVRNEATIFTVDNATTEDMRDVNLTFICGRYYCSLGQSNWLSLGAAAGITKRLPYCVNGIIKGSKRGFEDAKMFIQTDTDGKSYVLALNPVKEFQNYKVVKHLLSNPGASMELDSGEEASILIKGKDIGFESFALYPKEADSAINIANGKDAAYEVTIYVSDEENIVGGYSGDWKVSKNDLINANEIVFHVIEQGPATDDERFLFLSGLKSYSKRVPMPELKS